MVTPSIFPWAYNRAMSQDIQNELDNPLERLAALPEMMSWLGEWTVDTEYYQNNVVTDPITTGSYIYTGFSSAIRGGLPPSQVIGPSIWTAFGSIVASGVQQLKEGDGILVDGSDTVPTVSNTGVLTTTTQGSLQNIGTSQFPVLIYENSITQVQQGLGITVDNTDPNQPKINNTGILDIYGDGISVTGEYDLTLENSGILLVAAAPSTAILITGSGQNPIVNNTGTASITEGVGIAKEPGLPANEPQLNNTGVLSLVPRNIAVAGGFPGPGDKELKLINSVKTLVFNSQNLVMTPTTLVNDGDQALIPITQSVGTFWEDVMENGPPSYTNPQGSTFILDFALKFTGTASAAGISLEMYLQDNTSSPLVFEVGPFILKYGAIGASSQVPERIYLFSSVAVRVEQARASGFRKLTGLRIRKIKLGSSALDTIRLASSGLCSASWFNQTVPFPS